MIEPLGPVTTFRREEQLTPKCGGAMHGFHDIAINPRGVMRHEVTFLVRFVVLKAFPARRGLQLKSELIPQAPRRPGTVAD